jgi:hypothetical protein
MADELREWDQQPGEPTLWYDRFWKWLHDPRRSLLGVYNAEREKARKRPAQTSPGAWREAVVKWNWEARAHAWDDYEHERLEEEWETRRKQLREVEWVTAQALIEKAKQMLVFPLASTTREQVEEGGKMVTVTTVNPARWNLRDAATLAETASKLARLAASLPTDKSEVNVIDKRSAEELTDDELAAIAARGRDKEKSSTNGSGGGTPTPTEGA